ncbi:hypothetical protein ACK1FZ_004041, partial [Salmonella enterica]
FSRWARVNYPIKQTLKPIPSAFFSWLSGGSFPAIYAITGRRAREISLLMKIFEKKADPFFFLLTFCFYLVFISKRKDPGIPCFG